MAPEYRKDYIVSRTAPPSQLQLGAVGEDSSSSDHLLLRHQHQSHHHHPRRPSSAPNHAHVGSSSSGGRYEEGGSGSGSDSPTSTRRSTSLSFRSPSLRSQSLRSTHRADMTRAFDDTHSGTSRLSMSQTAEITKHRILRSHASAGELFVPRWKPTVVAPTTGFTPRTTLSATALAPLLRPLYLPPLPPKLPLSQQQAPSSSTRSNATGAAGMSTIHTTTQPFSPSGAGAGTMVSPTLRDAASYQGLGREGGFESGAGLGLGFTAGGPGLGPVGSYGVGGYAGAGEDMGIDRVLRAMSILGQASSVPSQLYADLSAVLQVDNTPSRYY